MATFELNRPIETRTPRIEVDAGLPPGRYRFALTVMDAAGNESRQDFQTVQVRQRGGGRIPRGPGGVRGPNFSNPTRGNTRP